MDMKSLTDKFLRDYYKWSWKSSWITFEIRFWIIAVGAKVAAVESCGP